MNYNQNEKTALSLLNADDFRSVTKNQITDLIMNMGTIDPAIATAVIEKYPEFASFTGNGIVEATIIAEKIMDSNGATTNVILDMHRDTITELCRQNQSGELSEEAVLKNNETMLSINESAAEIAKTNNQQNMSLLANVMGLIFGAFIVNLLFFRKGHD